jgi:fatty acid desaturase
MVLMDYWFTSRDRARILTIVFWVIGIVALAYGIWALWPWIGYQVR